MPSPKIQRQRHRPYKVSLLFPTQICPLSNLEDTTKLITESGQISASLTSLSRTIDDYSETAKKELIPTKQEKAHERIKTFRSDLVDYRQTFNRLKKDREDSVRPP